MLPSVSFVGSALYVLCRLYCKWSIIRVKFVIGVSWVPPLDMVGWEIAPYPFSCIRFMSTLKVIGTDASLQLEVRCSRVYQLKMECIRCYCRSKGRSMFVISFDLIAIYTVTKSYFPYVFGFYRLNSWG